MVQWATSQLLSPQKILELWQFINKVQTTNTIELFELCMFIAQYKISVGDLKARLSRKRKEMDRFIRMIRM